MAEPAIAIGLILLAFLLAAKASLILWYVLAKHVNPLADVPGARVMLVCGYDVFLSFAAALLVRVCLELGRLHRLVNLLLVHLVLPASYVAVVTFTVVSFQVTRIYQSPLDIEILRSADDMIVIGDSIGAYLDPLPLILLAVGLAAYPVLRKRIAARLERRRWLRGDFSLWTVAAAFGVGMPAMEFFALRQIDTLGVKDNAVVFFVHYYEPPMRPIDAPRILAELDQQLAGRESEVRTAKSLIIPSGFVSRDVPAPQATGRGMNLLLIQMESTTALQVDPASTPNLMALARTGVRFRNHTTTFTETSRASYSVHFSDYMPDLGTQPSQVYGRAMPQKTLAEVLQAAGYRTGLFHAGFLDFMELRYYLKDKGFETLVSARELKQKGLKVSSPSGMREEEAVDELKAWVRSHRAERFCAVYMTLAPHHPYHCYSGDQPFDTSTWLGRYRNSLHYADEQIGRVVQFLRDEQLLDNTVIVIYGDHGETISTYPVGHGIALSAEELMTPFIVSSARLFPGPGESQTYSNHLDIAPTVSRLLDLKPSPEWLGRDLLADKIPARLQYSRVLHIKKTAAIDNGLLFAFDETRGSTELYNFRDGSMVPLAQDDSMRSLAGDFASAVELFRTWNVQHHLARAVGRPAASAQDSSDRELLHKARTSGEEPN